MYCYRNFKIKKNLKSDFLHKTLQCTGPEFFQFLQIVSNDTSSAIFIVCFATNLELAFLLLYRSLNEDKTN